MRIHNVRLGFATNSSSKHSFIITNEQVEDELTGDFGWSWFILSSKEQKAQYMCSQLYVQLIDTISKDAAKTLIKGLVGVNVEEAVFDHQSCIIFPYSRSETYSWRNNSFVDLDYFRELFNFVVNTDGLVILGGNDNDDRPYNRVNGISVLSNILLEEYDARDFISRKDNKYNYWSLFNKKNGKKIRFSFDDKEVTKSLYPELVDLKITDYCDKGCKFCYQGSTKKGKHADVQNVRNILAALGEMNVFEVAIGGGEPTLHPEFAEILNIAKREGTIPNFSTATYSWLINEGTVEAVKENVGGFAYSYSYDKKDGWVTHPAVIKHIISMFDKFGLRDKLSLQIIPNLFDEYALSDIFKVAAEEKIPVTLLGYKTVGRAKNYGKPYNVNWVEKLGKLKKENISPTIGIDTSLAVEYADKLKGYPGFMYSKKEGDFSMYIDAVKEEAGPSSFCNKELMKSLNTDNDPIPEVDFGPEKDIITDWDADPIVPIKGHYDWEKEMIINRAKLVNKIATIFSEF
jgi:pyruvate-formate lyase-activating enzyme